ncbi:exopolysaccharide biosynthesis polyprenyl glycosylphosphotransferase [Geodermatophilus saharensis]|uniref:Exopolysaccharide biosynthesis polyprenyl glycosylphosphotransferase n=1 Tax=Geodermatophilus saharensis TaxID=1137994 RepID=A0A239IAK7_9ACTN|nr:sugar transferase [Geodermatophilus saharensis]SNS90615.1 exopolysaccharide biosynthesis polyprenyl glycosylphosphotransferase [Geodermatophilus saharensis]
MVDATGGDVASGRIVRRPSAVRVRIAPGDAAHIRPVGIVRRQPWWLRRGVGPYLVLTDVLAFAVATVITTPGSPIAHGLALGFLLLVFWRAGLYRSRLTLSLLDDLPYVLAAVAVAWALKVSLFSVLPGVDGPGRQVVHLLVVLAAVLLFRLVAYRVVHLARCRGLVRHRTLIVGAGPVGVRVATTLLERRNYGLDPIGFLDTEWPAGSAPLLPVPLLGRYHRLGQAIQQLGVRDVVVAYGGVDEDELVDILRTCDRLDVEVFVVPRLFELHHTNRYTDEIWGIPLIRRRRSVYRSPWWRAKRLVDVAVSALSLLLLVPVLAACALAVRLEGGPGIIFRQERVGLDGRPFQVLKFRSLKPVDETESQTQWNIKHDDRLGPVGRFLRATSLDELPQLWNILRGDMSLVGPRPERPHFVEQFSAHIPRYTARHRVPAGLTGWAQSHGLRGDTSIEDRARFDNYYIENWSPWLDMKIVLKTVGQVLRRQGG